MGVEAKQVKLLLVGPDCSGKSTLANDLTEHFGVTIYRNRRIGDKLLALHSVLSFAVHSFADNEHGFILDQWQFPVDIIYNHVIREESSEFEGLAPVLVEAMQKHKVFTIHLTASNAEIRRRFAIRGDELWDIDQVLKIAGNYKAYLEHWGLPYVTVDTTGLTPAQVLTEALEAINKYYGGGADV